jgi:hypothetical protein
MEPSGNKLAASERATWGQTGHFGHESHYPLHFSSNKYAIRDRRKSVWAARGEWVASRNKLLFSVMGGVSGGLPGYGPWWAAWRAARGPTGRRVSPQWHLWVDSLPPEGAIGGNPSEGDVTVIWLTSVSGGPSTPTGWRAGAPEWGRRGRSEPGGPEGGVGHDGQLPLPLYRRKSVGVAAVRRRDFSRRKLFIGYALNAYVMKFLFALSLSGRHDRRISHLYRHGKRGLMPRRARDRRFGRA